IDRRVLLGGAGGRGLAILATEEVAAQVIRRGTHPVAQTASDLNSTYPRGVAAVRLSVPGGGAVVVASTHLALQEDNRMRHAEHLSALVRGAGAPVIVGGDLNEPASATARRFLPPLPPDPAGGGAGGAGSAGGGAPQRPPRPQRDSQRHGTPVPVPAAHGSRRAERAHLPRCRTEPPDRRGAGHRRSGGPRGAGGAPHRQGGRGA